MKELFYTVIPNFTNSIVVSNKTRVKPYRKGFKTPKLPMKYEKFIGTDYFWNTKGYLVDKFNNVIPANASKAGLPKLWVCNFQDLYSGKIHKFSANSYIQKMKDYILPYLEDNEFVHEEGLTLELKFFLEPKANWTHNMDIDNLQSLWFKAILDAMKETIIVDDHPYVVRETRASVEFVETSETRLEIRLWTH